MDIAKAFEVAFNRKIEKNWEKIYVVVDIHDTILHACYENEETYDYYPYSREALQLMTNREDICLILWSGCYDEIMNEYRSRFAEEGILIAIFILSIGASFVQRTTGFGFGIYRHQFGSLCVQAHP